MRRVTDVEVRAGERRRTSPASRHSGGNHAAAHDAPLSVTDDLTALSESALHITVYELLAHAYTRVAIQHFHDSGATLQTGMQRLPASLFAPALPPSVLRQIVAALFADSARALATFFGFEEMNFLLLDAEARVYRLTVREGSFFPNFQPGIYQQPFGTGILGQCHLERRTVLHNDVAEALDYVRTDPTVRSELCVPVLMGDEVLALIDSGASRVNAFSAAHASFIEGFARYLAPAITDPWSFLQTWRPQPVRGTPALAPLAQSLNFLAAWHEEWRSRFARLYLEAAQRNAELLALTDLGESLSSTLRLDTVLSTTVKKVAQLLSCEVSWILLPDADGRLCMRALHGGSSAGLGEAALAPDGSPQFAVYARGEPMITNVLEDHLPHSSFDWAFCGRNGITCFLTVPLRTRERIIGVMNVGRTHAGDDFGERDARLLSTFAGQIALYIENADLYEQSRLLGAVEERNRLARDLHDTLVQSLVGILHTLEAADAVQQPMPPALRGAFTQARTLAVQSLDEARRSLWNLHPVELADQSLDEALREWVELWCQRTGIAAAFRVVGMSSPRDPKIEAEILRIGQEALGNVARHARAVQVEVSIEYATAGLRLTIADDGAGFDPRADTVGTPDATPPRRTPRRRSASRAPREQSARSVPTALPESGAGFGLRGMHERARLIGGWLQIESAPGWGTRVVLTLPATPSTPETRASGRASVPAARPQRAFPEAGRTPAAPAPAGTAAATLSARATEDSSEPKGHISLVLADDHPAVRDGLRLAFTAAGGFRILGAAASAREALDLVQAELPDVLLLDMLLPDGDGLDVLGRLRAASSPTRVVMLTAHLDDAHMAAALRAGAAGYLDKGSETRQIVAAVRAAARGRLALSPAIADRLRAREGLLVNVAAAHLTRREREVLESLAAGLSYDAIAIRLSISVATVKFHVIHLYQKLNASRRIEALNHAREWGLLR